MKLILIGIDKSVFLWSLAEELLCDSVEDTTVVFVLFEVLLNAFLLKRNCDTSFSQWSDESLFTSSFDILENSLNLDFQYPLYTAGCCEP